MTPYNVIRDMQGKPAHWKPRLAEHISVVRAEGRTVYLSEPHQLHPEAFRDFFLLEGHGWQVNVDSRSMNNPGHTVRVRITRAVT